MKAVNLVPADARRGRASSRGGPSVHVGSVGPAQFALALLVIVVALVLLRVLADNSVNNKKATLAAVKSEVATEQAQAAGLNVYVTFVQAAEQREQQVQLIAEQRFAWKRSFDQLSHVLPVTTSLTSLTATTTAATTTDSTGATVSGPNFALAGCSATANQNGVATVLRRLAVLSGVTDVGFQSSTRDPGCGNSFSVTLTFLAPGTTSTATGASTTSAVPSTTTTATTTTTTG